MTVALSVRQPFAWAIFHAGMDVDNRDWPTQLRGRVLIHATATVRQEDYNAFQRACRNPEHWLCQAILQSGGLPRKEDLLRGGILGEVEIADCVTEHPSPWFTGPYGFVLRNPQIMPFKPVFGSLRFFDVDEPHLGNLGCSAVRGIKQGTRSRHD
ncbi:ASCH domain-containing protein [Microvirga sp. Mcv34]|uniref:ASCH domain-containing protein n=1 Tax=Microvirga sp. Mcv34 TaxID=2926016 RepID=UPI0021C79989|nr:ASCH domain-containing protein [Microvirga sp. Mcv34]